MSHLLHHFIHQCMKVRLCRLGHDSDNIMPSQPVRMNCHFKIIDVFVLQQSLSENVILQTKALNLVKKLLMIYLVMMVIS